MMDVKLYNNLTRKKELFKPVTAGEVKFYSCGPTTYDFVHVGNAMALVVGDLINRIFKALGYKVRFVRNFTDVDDKIINKAKERGVDPLKHSEEFLKECEKDIISLGLLPVDDAPKVTETMPEIISMIRRLIDKDYAYVINGEVLYHTPMFKEYGKLSKKDLESLQHGIRVEVETHKKHPSDFVLWKPAKDGEPWWDSPWGKGRPGWHIECSAMSKKFLGDTIDIHHGGVDLMFPHHENEIAQSEAANGKPFVNYWCHNGFLNFGDEKMSKSIGNVVTIRNFVEMYGGEILRQVLVSAHYRSGIEWNDSAIERAVRDVERIHKFLLCFEDCKKNNIDKNAILNNEINKLKKVIPEMKKELANDLNVPGMLGIFFSFIRDLNRDFFDENFKYDKKKKINKELVLEIEQVLEFTKLATGLIHDDPSELIIRLNKARKNLNADIGELTEETIEKLLNDRKIARANKDFKRSDEIRDELKAADITIKDNPDGTTSWKY